MQCTVQYRTNLIVTLFMNKALCCTHSIRVFHAIQSAPCINMQGALLFIIAPMVEPYGLFSTAESICSLAAFGYRPRHMRTHN